MGVLIGILLLIASFAVTAALLAVWQTWVRLRASSQSADANYRRCAWVALVGSVWWPSTMWMKWGELEPMFASLSDQRLFLLGVTPTLVIIGLTSVVQPWLYSIRSGLLAANLFAVGLYYGILVGTVSWPWSMMTYGWVLAPAFGFGGSIWFVLRSKPGQGWRDWASSASATDRAQNGSSV